MGKKHVLDIENKLRTTTRTQLIQNFFTDVNNYARPNIKNNNDENNNLNNNNTDNYTISNIKNPMLMPLMTIIVLMHLRIMIVIIVKRKHDINRETKIDLCAQVNNLECIIIKKSHNENYELLTKVVIYIKSIIGTLLTIKINILE